MFLKKDKYESSAIVARVYVVTHWIEYGQQQKEQRDLYYSHGYVSRNTTCGLILNYVYTPTPYNETTPSNFLQIKIY